MPPQLFMSLVQGYTPGDMVGAGFSKLQSPSFALSAANSALRSELSSPAPRTCQSSSIVSMRPRVGAAICGGKGRSTHEG